jgi:hypothetical protein
MMTESEARVKAKLLAARMGDGWTDHVFVNFSWHYYVKRDYITIRDDSYGTITRYSAWIDPDLQIGDIYFQIIESAGTPELALDMAKQKALESITKIRIALDT